MVAGCRQVLRDQVVVLEGIVDGDEIVVVGHRSLVDGDRLLVSRRGACCEEGRIIYGARDKGAAAQESGLAPETEEPTR